MISIENGIAPPTKTGRGRPAIYPFGEMSVGDSFFVEGKTINTISPQATQNGQKEGKKFACRTVEGGVRVWRIS